MASSPHILLVDDDPQIRHLACALLAREFPDSRVETVTDQRALDKALTDERPRVVVTDYQLGWSDGLTVLRTVRTRCPDCPVIMFTGSGSEEIAVQAMKAGLDDYILKSPEHLVRLPAAIRSALDARAARTQLQEAEARYRELFERVPVGLFCCSPSGQVLDGNRALLDLLGCPDLDTLRRTPSDAFYVNPEDRRVWEGPAREGRGQVELAFWLRRLDGRTIWVKGKVQAVRDAEGRVRSYEGFIEDHTDRKQMEAQARHTARVAAMGELVGAIAHQLRNPLFILSGYLQLIGERLADDPPRPDLAADLEKAETAVQRLTEIIDRFVTLAHARTFRRETCSLPAAIRETLDLLASELMMHQIRVTTDLAPDLPPVVADPQDLHEVLLNLILNASQAMAEAKGGGTLDVAASVAEDGRVEIRIRDDGPGIAPEHRDRLFEPFFSTKAAGGGTGLGLWTVKRILMGLGGTIAYDSEPGNGTTFVVRLPARAGLRS